jgi:hypothetical protein
VQAAFRCLVRFGPIDPKAPDALSGRVHTCWINPDAQPAAADAASPPAAGAAPAPAAPPPAQPAPALAPAAPKK